MTWWHYLLLANVYLVVLYGFYVMFLRKETFFQLNRIYLVGAALLSFFIPLIQADWIRNLFITQQVQQTIYNLPVAGYQFNAAVASDRLTMGQIIALVYLGGIVVLTIKLIWQLISLKRIIDRPEPTEAAYSFFNQIRVTGPTEDREIITAHELAHARQWHSADILLIEAIMIINWFNPIVYFYRKSIKHIHEFIADQDALKAGTDKAEYAMLLLSQTFITPAHQLVNPFFNHSLLKQRIIMLQKNKSQRIKLIKYGLSAPLFGLMLILSSATVNNSQAVNMLHDKAEEVFLMPAADDATSEISTTELSPVSDTTKAKKHGGAPVFYTVEHPADYPGGIQALYSYLQKNIHYPAAAREKNVQGKVFVQYIVEADGRLSDIKVVRGIGSGCDEEAVRVIKSSRRWTPGVQNGRKVRSMYTIPIVFSLVKTVANAGQPVPQPVHIVATVPDSKPAMFPGGIENLYQFLYKNIKYPAEARQKNVQGKVFVQCVVETDGHLTDVKVLREPGAGLGEEALRVLALSPNWIPGEQNDTKVRSIFTMPINFSLDGQKTNPKDSVLKKVEMIMIRRHGDAELPVLSNNLTFRGTADTARLTRRVFFYSNEPGSKPPLYIIDGKEQTGPELPPLSPGNIQSINVLKGAASISRYGKKGETGVVLITTSRAANSGSSN